GPGQSGGGSTGRRPGRSAAGRVGDAGGSAEVLQRRLTAPHPASVHPHPGVPTMPSMKKAEITPALVSSLVAAQFPQWAGLPITRLEVDGNDNTTFRLGEEMSVRLPSAERYVAQVDKEQRWLPILAGHLPLPIPQPLARGAPGSGYPWPWSVY